MDSVSSRTASSPLLNSVLPATRTILARGEGIRLVATCLWSSTKSQMSIGEMYEWLAEYYPQYRYKKSQIRHVVEQDCNRKHPRFMIANRRCPGGVPVRWSIRPEMESELRRLYPPLERESDVFHSLDDRCDGAEHDQPAEAKGSNKPGSDATSIAIAAPRKMPQDDIKGVSLYTRAAIQLGERVAELGRVKIDGDCMHNLLPRSIADELGFILHSGGTIRIRVENRSIPCSLYCRFNVQIAGFETTIDACVVSELPSLRLGRPWIQGVSLLRSVGSHVYYIRGPLGNLSKLPDPASAIEIDTDLVTGEHEAACVAEELPIARECELEVLASSHESTNSATGDETTTEDEIWEDAVSSLSTGDDVDSVDRTTAEKQENEGMYYLLLWDDDTGDQSTREPQPSARWILRTDDEERGQVKRTRDLCSTNHGSRGARTQCATMFPRTDDASLRVSDKKYLTPAQVEVVAGLLISKDSITYFIDNCRWIYEFCTSARLLTDNAESNLINALNRVQRLLKGNRFQRLLLRFAYMHLVNATDTCKAVAAIDRNQGNANRSIGVGDATIAYDMYRKANPMIHGENLKRSTVLGYCRAGRRWAALAGASPLLVFIFPQRAETIVQNNSITDMTVTAIAYQIQTQYPELTKALFNIGQHTNMAPSSMTNSMVPIEDIVLKTTAELGPICQKMP